VDINNTKLTGLQKDHKSLVAVVHRLDITKGYDKIGVMKSGKIEEMGT